eukprot:54743-Chlamydomonas_euryale.AAC.1
MERVGKGDRRRGARGGGARELGGRLDGHSLPAFDILPWTRPTSCVCLQPPCVSTALFPTAMIRGGCPSPDRRPPTRPPFPQLP